MKVMFVVLLKKLPLNHTNTGRGGFEWKHYF